MLGAREGGTASLQRDSTRESGGGDGIVLCSDCDGSIYILCVLRLIELYSKN